MESTLSTLQDSHLLRTIKDKESPQGTTITVDKQKLINFSSNDYLGLSCHADTIEAVKKAIDIYGVGAGSSRLLRGGTLLHTELEKQTALFKGTQSALLFSSGYHANLGAITALTGKDDAIFSDELNHASIIDGCKLSKARRFIYKHADPSHLDMLLKSSPTPFKLVITESVFSMDGDIAPLDEILTVCKKHGALCYVDDAHGTGILGKSGRGIFEHFHLEPDENVIIMGTYSKALGSHGAFTASTPSIANYLINKARPLIYTTAPSVPDVAASLHCLKFIENHTEVVETLRTKASALRKLLNAEGFNVPVVETPIIPIEFASINECLTVSSYMEKNGFYSPAIRPPTVKTPRIRISIQVNHTEQDFLKFCNALNNARKT